MPDRIGEDDELFEVSNEISDRLITTFPRDEQGRRPVYGGTRSSRPIRTGGIILFYEYFHGDNGAGLGASHQTGWTGLVAKLIELYGILDPERALEMGKNAAFIQGARAEQEQDPVSRGTGRSNSPLGA